MHGVKCSPIFLLILVTLGTTYSIRTSKENNRPKSECISNFSSLNGRQSHRQRCIALNHPYCLDLRLPYNSTIIPENIGDLNLVSSQEIQNYLEQWRGIQKLPECWPILQVALCSLLMPKCDDTDGLLIHEPSVDICNDLTKGNHCQFIERHLEGWPDIFNCSDSRYYARNCSNDLRELRYVTPANSERTCQYPLVATTESSNFFREINGCNLHCKYPVIDREEQANINLTIGSLSLVGLASTSASIVLLMINEPTSRPSRLGNVIKRCTICHLLCYIGWSLQLFLDQEVACHQDGSTLIGHPLVASPCVLSFLLTYLPSLSSLLWCAYIGKLFHEKLNDHDCDASTKLKSDRTLSLFAYGIPLTLFVFVAFVGRLDGHGLYGICTVGQDSLEMKTVFVFGPTLLGTILANYFFLKIIIKLTFSEEKLKPSLKRNLVRISALSSLTIIQITFSILNHYYELNNRKRWYESIENFVACEIGLTDHGSDASYRMGYNDQKICNLTAKPVVTPFYVELLATLGIGVVISSWAFHSSNITGLRRILISLLEDKKDLEHRVEVSRQGATERSCSLDAHSKNCNDMSSIRTQNNLIDMDDLSTMLEDEDVSLRVIGLEGSGGRSGSSLSRWVSFQTMTSLRSMTLCSRVFNTENESSMDHETMTTTDYRFPYPTHNQENDPQILSFFSKLTQKSAGNSVSHSSSCDKL